ncbi:hypothetical protein I552_9297 [Mycobacterium xenopi 3993]|nr:hypothetical protein I552_9297 [Mycobacterium xenopi 3993]
MGGDDRVITLTPSSLQTLTDCPLRWLVERHGGTDPRDLGATLGSLLHALIAEPGSSQAQLLTELERAWEHLPFESPWYAANELARHRAMIEAFLAWRAQSRRELTQVGVEVDIDGVVETAGAAGARVRLRGRIDRLERDAAGRLVVVDVKTGKTPVSKDDAQRHAQLALYQLAVAEGLLPHGDEPGGARLVYLGRSGPCGPAEREQDPLTPAARDEWRQLVGRPPRQWPARGSSPGQRRLPALPDAARLPAHAGAHGDGHAAALQPSRIGSRAWAFRAHCRTGRRHRRGARAGGGHRRAGPAKPRRWPGGWCGWWPMAMPRPIRCWG